MISSFRRAALVAGAAAILGLTPLAAANAAVVGSVSTTDGMSGYLVNELGTTYKSIVATFDLTPHAPDLGVGSGVIGVRLCNNQTGNAAGFGAVLDTDGRTFSIDYSLGTLNSNGGDPCVNNGILAGTSVHPLLSALAIGQSVTVLIRERRHSVLFAATEWGGVNNGRSFSTWVSCGGRCPAFNEPEAGIQENPAVLGGPAGNDIVDFTGVYIDTASTNAPAIPFGGPNAFTINSSANGNAPWLVGPAANTHTGPNNGTETCLASLTTDTLTVGGPQLGPLTPGGSSFSICAATLVGA